ncbi:MAG: peptidoglycan -binding protein [Ascidiaceihabitans sp.]|nr:peptidoglycan -binding protein [Ascidiaceihabitans sp.]
MALSRRTGARFQASIWPGFVDAMTGLLLVLMFVLTIFMVVQFVLRETISGQETELNTLAGEVAALAQALGLEERRGNQLDARLTSLNATLNTAQDQVAAQAAMIANLTAQRDASQADLADANTQLTNFEAQVAALLSQRDGALATVAQLEGEQTRLLSKQEALNAALAQARTEIDEGVEAARLAASRREALDALIADLRAKNSDATDRALALEGQLEDASRALSAEEAAKLAEAAAAEALRARLENADAELTAMTLALEAQRQDAEDTLSLLAAARSAQADLDTQLIAALLQIETLQTGVSGTAADRDAARQSADALRAEKAQLESDLAGLRTALNAAQSAIRAGTTDAEDLRSRLAAALNAQLQAEAARSSAEDQVAEGQVSMADLRAQLAVALAAKLALEGTLGASDVDMVAVREQLAAALAAKLRAEQTANDLLTAAEQRQALLQAAQSALSDEEKTSLDAQRQTELLNQQVADLRAQLGGLQVLLDEAVASDASKEVQLQSLGTNLNNALARVAAEERRNRLLEEAERKRLEAEAQDLEKYRSEFFGRLRDVLGNQEGVRIEGDRFVFSSEVLFPPGGADLSRAGEGEIAKIADILRSIAGDIPPEINWVIRVDGHTDNVPLSGQGEFADNWELSQARALSVVKYMANFLGIPPGRLAANGFGQYQPVNNEDTAAARAQNRRIELKFTEK